jgi:hypothetical protein
VQVELVPLVGLIWLLVPCVGKNTTAPLQVIVHLPRARALAARIGEWVASTIWLPVLRMSDIRA